MKSKIKIVALVLAIGAVCFGFAIAGTLDPPGPPGPTMVTLQQVYDKIAAQVGMFGVPRTGQTTCSNATGVVINCAGTGQDAAFQYGVVVTPRFTDNGDGTVRDNATGLIWIKDRSCFGGQTWTAALNAANALASGTCGLSDGSVAGMWRLPNLRELLSIIDYGQDAPALPAGHPFGSSFGLTWTSTSYNDNLYEAWYIETGSAEVRVDWKSSPHGMWPVRGGR